MRVRAFLMLPAFLLATLLMFNVRPAGAEDMFEDELEMEALLDQLKAPFKIDPV